MQRQPDSQNNGRRLWATAALFALFALAYWIAYEQGPAQVAQAQARADIIANNRPAPNPNGAAATFSTAGPVDLTGE